MASNDISFIPSFIKIGQLIQKVKVGETHAYFLSLKKSGLNIRKYFWIQLRKIFLFLTKLLIFVNTGYLVAILSAQNFTKYLPTPLSSYCWGLFFVGRDRKCYFYWFLRKNSFADLPFTKQTQNHSLGTVCITYEVFMGLVGDVHLGDPERNGPTCDTWEWMCALY
jgi:hypothetical protein